MSRRCCQLLVVLAALVPACARPAPERQLIFDAADALGGRDRVAAVTSFAVEGEGEAPNAGQNTMPDSELPVWKVTEYKRTTDLMYGRSDMTQTRTAQFQFANAPTQQQHQGLDGGVAVNYRADGEAIVGTEAQARERRREMLHHPVAAVQAGLGDETVLSNLRQQGDDDLVDILTTKGDAFTLAVSRATKLPVRVSMLDTNANMGDVIVATAFRDYEDVAGVKMPKRLTTTMDKYLQFDLRVSRNAVNVDTARLAAPAHVLSASPQAAPAVRVTVEPIARGIWRLAGSGNHRSIVLEFDDHLLLFEAPLNEARSRAVIEEARKLSDKPLTHVVISHHHFDHSGGLRVAVAEGLTVITHKANEAFFKELLARPWTVQPDQLAKSPRTLKLELVDDALTLKDGSMELQLYHLLDNPREGTNIFGYVPRDRLLIQADLYDNTWERHLWGQNVLDNIERRKLRVDRDVPVHGDVEPFAAMVQNIRTKTGVS